jgi:hypothetical protein
MEKMEVEKFIGIISPYDIDGRYSSPQELWDALIPTNECSCIRINYNSPSYDDSNGHFDIMELRPETDGELARRENLERINRIIKKAKKEKDKAEKLERDKKEYERLKTLFEKDK